MDGAFNPSTRYHYTYDMPGSLEKGLEGVIDVGGLTKAVLSRALSDFFSYSRVSELYICCLLLEPSNVSENLSTST